MRFKLHTIRRLRGASVLLCVLVAGLLCTEFAYRALHETEQLRVQELRTTAGQSVLEAFQEDLTRTIEVVRTSGLMIESHPVLHRLQFNAFSARVMVDLHTLAFLEWQPVVRQAELANFEAMARREGLADYRVIEPDGSRWIPARPRSEYLPVLYGWPQDSAALGVDMAFDPARMESKQNSRVIGRPVASAPFKIITDGAISHDRLAFAISSPVYQPIEGESRGQGLTGYVAGVVELGALMQSAVSLADAAKFDVLVYDVESKTPGPIFAWYGEGSDLNRANPPRGNSSVKDQSQTIDVATRPWEIVLHPRPSFFTGMPRALSPIARDMGIIASVLLTLAAFMSQRSRQKIADAQVVAQNAGASLTAERQRLHNILEGTDAGTWELNLQTGELISNDRWLRMLGYRDSEINPVSLQTWLDLTHPDELEPMRAYLQRLTLGEANVIDVESRRKHKDGNWVWVRTRGRVNSHTADGQPEWAAGITQDISAGKQAEAQVIEFNNTLELRVQERGTQLESAMETLSRSQEELVRSESRATLGTLVASVSHEMSTPMGNSVMAASTLVDLTREFQGLIDAGKLHKSDLNQFLEQIRDGSGLLLRNLERAVDLLKNFRQVAADQASEQRRSFDLQQAVTEVVKTLAPSLKRKPHLVVVDMASGISMDSFPGPLGQVVINLINNAYLHAFDDASPGQFTIHAQADGEFARLTFQDNGKGMTPHTLESIFKPFFSTRIGSGGTGLGMSIVENLVSKVLGGTLSVQSELGAGTTITVTLPRTAPTPVTEG